MRMSDGPLAYESRHSAMRLSEEEEALLAFAACGITGHALGDLAYGSGGGGEIMAGLLGRTSGSGDAIHTVSVFVINPDGTYLLRRPRDFEPAEIPELVELSRSGRFAELYRRSRILIKTGRETPPLSNFFNLRVNRWSLYDPARGGALARRRADPSLRTLRQARARPRPPGVLRRPRQG
jgi:hypothetical protein